MDTHNVSHLPSRSSGSCPGGRPPRSGARGPETQRRLFRLCIGRRPLVRFLGAIRKLNSFCNRRVISNANLAAAARLLRAVVDFGTSFSISSSSSMPSSSLSASTCVSHASEAECEALLTTAFLPELEAFFLVVVDGAAFFPLLVPPFFPDGGRPVSEPNSLSGSSTSIAMESTDPASSSTPARLLAFPLLESIRIW